MYACEHWRNSRFESGGNFAERGPLSNVRGPLADTQKRTSDLMLNPDVDGYTKTLNHRIILRKTQKDNNLLKTKRMPKPKCKLNGVPVFTFSLPGRRFCPSVTCGLI